MDLARPGNPADFDVLGLGNAIVDVLTRADDDQLRALGLEKGAMTLVEEIRSDFLLGQMEERVEKAGGSVANSIAGVASLGGRAAYVGRVRDDRLGAVFRDDTRAWGVRFDGAPATSGPATARSLIFVTEDAQRTMQTYLGACVELGPEDVDDALVAASAVTFLEGYLWDRLHSKQACLKAAAICRESGGKLALTLADMFLVDRWRSDFLELSRDHVDILIANEGELMRLFETAHLDTALREAAAMVEVVAVTRGPSGSVIAHGDERVAVDAVAPERVLDTTGAGDLWAAGFLRGLTAGLGTERAARLGSHAASSVLSQIGPRPETSIASLMEAV